MTDTGTHTPSRTGSEISERQTGVLIMRVGLILAAILSAGLNGPVVVTTVLTAVAALVVAEALVRRRELGWEDGLLVGIAGTLIVLILLGLVLNLLPGDGFAAVPWAIGVQVPAIVAVVYVWWTSADAPPFALAGLNWVRVARSAPWYVAAAAAVVVAIAISVHATDTATRAPASLDLGSRSGATVSVRITGGPESARYELATRTGSGPTSHLDDFELGAGDRVTYPVTVPDRGRTVVDLRDADSDAVLGSLVVQGTS